MKEDGEISDEDVVNTYNVLSRPVNSKTDSRTMECDRNLDYSSDSSLSLGNDPEKDDNIKKINKKTSGFSARSNKKSNNIWSAALQEDCLMENFKECDVTTRKRERDVEHYDYTMKYRLNGESSNNFKRRKSNSTDYDSDQRTHHSRNKKKSKRNNDKRFKKNCYDDSSNDERNCTPRIILELNTTLESSNEEFARDMSNKLFEDKDDLILRIVETLGKEATLMLFKETQKIESEGGMMIMNGRRRRTPGGVFFFLLKKSDNISEDNLRAIFQDDKTKRTRERKDLQAMSREKKVAELKKTLNENGNELNIVPKIDVGLLKPESLSNPPPSPETDTNRELNANSEKIVNLSDCQREKSLGYDDDFLDMHADNDMELF